MMQETIVRPFNGSLADAEGLLAVERATFNETPYSPEQVQTLLSQGSQRAWLAVAGAEVIGFVIAFLTTGLRGPCWEIDLLAVHPGWTGRGLATQLIRAAAAGGAHLARQTRGVVAADNLASARAFSRAGFQPDPEICLLLIDRIRGLPPRPQPTLGVTIRQATSMAEAADRLGDLEMAGDQPGLTLLLAEQQGRPAGYAELIEVQTLLYRGVWIESLVASSRAVREALLREAVNRAKAAGLDEIGAMVPQDDWPLQKALLAEGFRSLGEFRWFTARLPLPGLAEGCRG